MIITIKHKFNCMHLRADPAFATILYHSYINVYYGRDTLCVETNGLSTYAINVYKFRSEVISYGIEYTTLK